MRFGENRIQRLSAKQRPQNMSGKDFSCRSASITASWVYSYREVDLAIVNCLFVDWPIKIFGIRLKVSMSSGLEVKDAIIRYAALRDRNGLRSDTIEE